MKKNPMYTQPNFVPVSVQSFVEGSRISMLAAYNTYALAQSFVREYSATGEAFISSIKTGVLALRHLLSAVYPKEDLIVIEGAREGFPHCWLGYTPPHSERSSATPYILIDPFPICTIPPETDANGNIILEQKSVTYNIVETEITAQAWFSLMASKDLSVTICPTTEEIDRRAYVPTSFTSDPANNASAILMRQIAARAFSWSEQSRFNMVLDHSSDIGLWVDGGRSNARIPRCVFTFPRHLAIRGSESDARIKPTINTAMQINRELMKSYMEATSFVKDFALWERYTEKASSREKWRYAAYVACECFVRAAYCSKVASTFAGMEIVPGILSASYKGINLSMLWYFITIKDKLTEKSFVVDPLGAEAFRTFVGFNNELKEEETSSREFIRLLNRITIDVRAEENLHQFVGPFICSEPAIDELQPYIEAFATLQIGGYLPQFRPHAELPKILRTLSENRAKISCEITNKKEE